MNQLKRYKILQACEYLLESLPQSQTNDIHNIYMKLRYRDDECLVLPELKKCETCGKDKSIFEFIMYKNSNSTECESKDCEHCRDYNNAKKGISSSLRYSNEVNKMFDVDNDEYHTSRKEYKKREMFIKSMVDNIPDEIIELKILITKIQKKLQKL